MKRIINIVLIAVVVGIFLGFLLFAHASNKAEDYYSSTNFYDLSNISGNFSGNFKLWGAIPLSKVDIIIENNKIIDIEFPKLVNTPTHYCKDQIVNQIKARQIFDFDAISGATRTSNFAKAAISNALKNNINETTN